ncbi:unnamed protein product, partial [Closterium sp. NIES-53]
DHFLSLCPTELTVDLLEERLGAAEKSILAVGASRGDRRTPFFEGCSPIPLLPSVASAAAVNLVGTEEVEAADHFLSLCPTELTVDLLEERLGAAEKSILAVGASRGDRRTPFFEGCSPIPLLPSVASAAAVNLVGTEEVEAASAPSGRHRNSKGKGSNGSGGDGGGGGGGGGRGRGGGSGGGGGAKSGGFSGIEAAALGASAFAAPGAGESALSGTAPTEALHTFTLDSGASRSFFRDSTTLTPLSRPIAVSLADPSGGPVLAHSSTVLPCLAAPSGLLSGLHLLSFSTNLVTGADLQDAWVVASSQVFAATSTSSPASAPCSCRPLSHETLLWHHRLGHPSLPRLRGMASRTLVSGLPRSLPPLPPGPAPTCAPCVEGRHPRPKQGLERYFLLVVDDYSRYTTVFPLRSKDRGGEFSSDLLRAFCRAEGIRQTFTLPASPQQNGIAERRIGMVMDVARTSMIHAAAPHFLWPFTVQYAEHQLNLQPRVSLPETTPTLRWMGKVGDASVFRVWGSRAFVSDTSEDKLSSRTVPCVFLGFPPDAPEWQFYHPTSRRVLSSHDVTFDESVSYYRLFPYRTASPLPLPLFLAPGTLLVDPLPLRVLPPQVCPR